MLDVQNQFLSKLIKDPNLGIVNQFLTRMEKYHSFDTNLFEEFMMVYSLCKVLDEQMSTFKPNLPVLVTQNTTDQIGLLGLMLALYTSADKVITFMPNHEKRNAVQAFLNETKLANEIVITSLVATSAVFEGSVKDYKYQQVCQVEFLGQRYNLNIPQTSFFLSLNCIPELDLGTVENYDSFGNRVSVLCNDNYSPF